MDGPIDWGAIWDVDLAKEACVRCLTWTPHRKGHFWGHAKLGVPNVCQGVPWVYLTCAQVYIVRVDRGNQRMSSFVMRRYSKFQELSVPWVYPTCVGVPWMYLTCAQVYIVWVDRENQRMSPFVMRRYSEFQELSVPWVYLMCVQVYIVRVDRENQRVSSFVMRRYSEFQELHRKLVMTFPLVRLPSLAGKWVASTRRCLLFKRLLNL